MDNLVATLAMYEDLAERQNAIILELIQTVQKQALEICQLRAIESCTASQCVEAAQDVVQEFNTI